LIELMRIMLPATVMVLVTSVLIECVSYSRVRAGWSLTIALFPVLFFLCAVAASLFVVGAKWMFMGRFQPGEKPLWSMFVWLNEMVTSLHENIANPLLVEHLMGTPFAAWFFRLMGSKIGSRVYLETTQFTEYDLIHIGDEACVNEDCTLQSHLFEDRVMKMSTLDIGAHCTIGSCAVVLYDTRMEEGSSLNHLSLLMKGEVLPAASHWEGSPARRAGGAILRPEPQEAPIAA
jgi:non-ribosomal peptide synthetase-like protein